ncbi:cell wall surface anchored protein [Planoprotostelium fungivorum]|uniref:Cell wall surface anchored protein n=1 Tax=Planoprotostelium fungivorum TaxID=1890364 RepID=A0A2P6N4J7_9EUKA|nr:cell wall surface anchored protein [Planoprotostelium fungivorum]
MRSTWLFFLSVLLVGTVGQWATVPVNKGSVTIGDYERAALACDVPEVTVDGKACSQVSVEDDKIRCTLNDVLISASPVLTLACSDSEENTTVVAQYSVPPLDDPIPFISSTSSYLDFRGTFIQNQDLISVSIDSVKAQVVSANATHLRVHFESIQMGSRPIPVIIQNAHHTQTIYLNEEGLPFDLSSFSLSNIPSLSSQQKRQTSSTPNVTSIVPTNTTGGTVTLNGVNLGSVGTVPQIRLGDYYFYDRDVDSSYSLGSPITTNTVDDCINQCISTSGCYSISWRYSTQGTCQLKTSNNLSPNNVAGYVYVVLGSGCQNGRVTVDQTQAQCTLAAAGTVTPRIAASTSTVTYKTSDGTISRSMPVGNPYAAPSFVSAAAYYNDSNNALFVLQVYNVLNNFYMPSSCSFMGASYVNPSISSLALVNLQCTAPFPANNTASSITADQRMTNFIFSYTVTPSFSFALVDCLGTVTVNGSNLIMNATAGSIDGNALTLVSQSYTFLKFSFSAVLSSSSPVIQLTLDNMYTLTGSYQAPTLKTAQFTRGSSSLTFNSAALVSNSSVYRLSLSLPSNPWIYRTASGSHYDLRQLFGTGPSNGEYITTGSGYDYYLSFGSVINGNSSPCGNSFICQKTQGTSTSIASLGDIQTIGFSTNADGSIAITGSATSNNGCVPGGRTVRINIYCGTSDSLTAPPSDTCSYTLSFTSSRCSSFLFPAVGSLSATSADPSSVMFPVPSVYTNRASLIYSLTMSNASPVSAVTNVLAPTVSNLTPVNTSGGVLSVTGTNFGTVGSQPNIRLGDYYFFESDMVNQGDFANKRVNGIQACLNLCAVTAGCKSVSYYYKQAGLVPCYMKNIASLSPTPNVAGSLYVVMGTACANPSVTAPAADGTQNLQCQLPAGGSATPSLAASSTSILAYRFGIDEVYSLAVPNPYAAPILSSATAYFSSWTGGNLLLRVYNIYDTFTISGGGCSIGTSNTIQSIAYSEIVLVCSTIPAIGSKLTITANARSSTVTLSYDTPAQINTVSVNAAGSATITGFNFLTNATGMTVDNVACPVVNQNPGQIQCGFNSSISSGSPVVRFSIGTYAVNATGILAAPVLSNVQYNRGDAVVTFNADGLIIDPTQYRLSVKLASNPWIYNAPSGKIYDFRRLAYTGSANGDYIYKDSNWIYHLSFGTYLTNNDRSCSNAFICQRDINGPGFYSLGNEGTRTFSENADGSLTITGSALGSSGSGTCTRVTTITFICVAPGNEGMTVTNTPGGSCNYYITFYSSKCSTIMFQPSLTISAVLPKSLVIVANDLSYRQGFSIGVTMGNAASTSAATATVVQGTPSISSISQLNTTGGVMVVNGQNLGDSYEVVQSLRFGDTVFNGMDNSGTDVGTGRTTANVDECVRWCAATAFECKSIGWNSGNNLCVRKSSVNYSPTTNQVITTVILGYINCLRPQILSSTQATCQLPPGGAIMPRSISTGTVFYLVGNSNIRVNYANTINPYLPPYIVSASAVFDGTSSITLTLVMQNVYDSLSFSNCNTLSISFINGTNSVSSLSTNVLSCSTLPSNVSTVSVSANGRVGTSPFVYLAIPVISSVSVAASGSVIIQGVNFITSHGIIISIDGNACTITAQANNVISCTFVPPLFTVSPVVSLQYQGQYTINATGIYSPPTIYNTRYFRSDSNITLTSTGLVKNPSAYVATVINVNASNLWSINAAQSQLFYDLSRLYSAGDYSTTVNNGYIYRFNFGVLQSAAGVCNNSFVCQYFTNANAATGISATAADIGSTTLTQNANGTITIRGSSNVGSGGCPTGMRQTQILFSCGAQDLFQYVADGPCAYSFTFTSSKCNVASFPTSAQVLSVGAYSIQLMVDNYWMVRNTFRIDLKMANALKSSQADALITFLPANVKSITQVSTLGGQIVLTGTNLGEPFNSVQVIRFGDYYLNGRDNIGYDITPSGNSYTNIDDCINWCASTTGCVGVVFNPNNQICYRKYSVAYTTATSNANVTTVVLGSSCQNGRVSNVSTVATCYLPPGGSVNPSLAQSTSTVTYRYSPLALDGSRGQPIVNPYQVPVVLSTNVTNVGVYDVTLVVAAINIYDQFTMIIGPVSCYSSSLPQWDPINAFSVTTAKCNDVPPALANGFINANGRTNSFLYIGPAPTFTTSSTSTTSTMSAPSTTSSGASVNTSSTTSASIVSSNADSTTSSIGDSVSSMTTPVTSTMAAPITSTSSASAASTTPSTYTASTISSTVAAPTTSSVAAPATSSTVAAPTTLSNTTISSTIAVPTTSSTVAIPTTSSTAAAPTTSSTNAVPATSSIVAAPTTLSNTTISSTVAVLTSSSTVAAPTTSSTVAAPTTLSNTTISSTIAAPTTSSTVAAPTTSSTVAAPTTLSNTTISSTIAAPTTSSTVAAPTTSSTVAAPTTPSTVAAPTTSSTVAAPTTSSTMAAPKTTTSSSVAAVSSTSPSTTKLLPTSILTPTETPKTINFLATSDSGAPNPDSVSQATADHLNIPSDSVTTVVTPVSKRNTVTYDIAITISPSEGHSLNDSVNALAADLATAPAAVFQSRSDLAGVAVIPSSVQIVPASNVTASTLPNIETHTEATNAIRGSAVRVSLSICTIIALAAALFANKLIFLFDQVHQARKKTYITGIQSQINVLQGELRTRDIVNTETETALCRHTSQIQKDIRVLRMENDELERKNRLSEENILIIQRETEARKADHEARKAENEARKADRNSREQTQIVKKLHAEIDLIYK